MAWIRSLSSSLGACLRRARLAIAFFSFEFFSPRAKRRFSSSVSRSMGLIATGFLVPGSSDTIVKAQVIKTSSSLTLAPFVGALATCRDISMLLLPVAKVTCPDNSRSQSSFNGWFMVIRSTAAVTVVTCSPVCLYAMTPDKASKSMKIVPSLGLL